MGVRFTPLMLSQAGFSESQIIDWVNNQRKYLPLQIKNYVSVISHQILEHIQQCI